MPTETIDELLKALRLSIGLAPHLASPRLRASLRPRCVLRPNSNNWVYIYTVKGPAPFSLILDGHRMYAFLAHKNPY